MKEINIQVLGSGCKTCKNLFDNVSDIAQKIDKNLKVEYVNDIVEIAKLGAMSSPVFAIDGVIISEGKIPKEEKIRDAILGFIKKN